MAKYEFLDSRRGEVNESEAKDMGGCIAKFGIVMAYVPVGQRHWGERLVDFLNQPEAPIV